MCQLEVRNIGSRRSLAMKRYTAAIEHGFLLKILAASASE